MLREAPGPYPALTRSFSTLVSDLLALDGELSEHLVRPGTLEAYDTELLRDLAAAKLSNADLRKIPETAEARRSLLGLTERYRSAKRSRDLLDFGDQIALSAELALTRPEVGGSCARSSGSSSSTSTRTRRWPSDCCSRRCSAAAAPAAAAAAPAVAAAAVVRSRGRPATRRPPATR